MGPRLTKSIKWMLATCGLLATDDTFWSVVVRFSHAWRSSPSAVIVTVWGSLLQRWCSARKIAQSIFAVIIRRDGSNGGGRLNSRCSSMPSVGVCDVHNVGNLSRPITPRLMPHLRWNVPAQPVSWRTRWRRRQAYLQWTAWVARNMYASSSTVLVQRPAHMGTAKRRSRLSHLRSTRPTSTRVAS